jgi:transposase-like protein
MELNPKQTKAALLLASGDTVTTTAEQVGVNRLTIHQWLREDDNFNAYLNSLKREFVDAGRSAMISAEKSHIENFTEKKIKKINAKTEQGLKKTVLKWRQLDKNNETTYPKYGQIVLAVNNNKEFAVCMFDGIKRKEFVIEERETTIVLNNVYAWMELPNAPIVSHIENDEYLIEQTALETFDIIDAITPALREAVKHLLVQQGASK